MESSNFCIVDDDEHETRQFRLTRRRINFIIADMPEEEDNPLEWVKSAISNLYNYVMANVDPDEKIGFSFSSEKFNNPAWIKFKRARDVNLDDIWDMLSSVLQSNSEGLNLDTFKIILTRINLPSGMGRKRKDYYNNYHEECRERQGFISVNNKDNLCLPRAIIIGKYYAKNSPLKVKVRNNVGKLQDIKVRNLLLKSRVDIPREGGGIPELRRLQAYLKNYQIIVYDYQSSNRDIIFKGPEKNREIKLIYSDNHYNVVNSVTAMFGSSYYCKECHFPFKQKDAHRCKKNCPCCQQAPPCERVVEVICNDCNRSFRGQSCFAKHKGNEICDKIRSCTLCLRTIPKNRTHTCGEMFCKICSSHQPENHLCHIQLDTRKPKTSEILFIFFYLETNQEKISPNQPNRKIHEPNLCAYEQRCAVCINFDSLYMCQQCGFRKGLIKTGDIIKQFIEFIFNKRKNFKNIVVITHNYQAFDHQFILKYILEQTKFKPVLLMRGTKLILMKVDNVKFIDSLNYFPMALSALPKAFDLPQSYKKAYFPHLFNTIANRNYVGNMPDLAYYSPDTMKNCGDCDQFCTKEGCRNNFLSWYHAMVQQNYKFDFIREFDAYCQSDVQILAQACVKFRKIILDQCMVCPFMESTTIASTCNLIFRRNFLKPKTIGIIPKNGYRKTNKHSKPALKWLIEESRLRNISIIHAGNNREVSINGLMVDGFCDATHEIFEFHGCYYHGHECLVTNRDKPIHKDKADTLNNRRRRTITKTEKLRRFGYTVIEKWECEFISNVPDTHPLLNYVPLNPRDAFYGGRTGNTRTYYKCRPGEKISYIDVCSLYPWVSKYGKFPVGHPTIYIDAECSNLNLQQTDGIIKCNILPPANLYHPVLPLKMNNRLMFLLCRTCGESFNQRNCTHTSAERSLTGTWVIDEVNEAIRKGYKMLYIYEIWKFETVQQNHHIEGLFTPFINKFLKMKQESSGWPSNCTTNTEKDKYIKEYRNKEGISLEESKIEKNAGRRSIAKITLNSFWGKFGQKENQSQTTIIREPEALYSLMTDPSIATNNIQEVNDNMVIVNWEYIAEASEISPIANVCIAAYTTTQARLKLYSYLEKLEERVLYYDTDSIIYFSQVDMDQYEPPLGSFLGDMTNELEEYGPGSYITEFVSDGPKNYAYEVLSPSDGKKFGKCKVKCFILNYENSQKINLERMRDIILAEEEPEPIPITHHNTVRTKTHEVVSITQTKHYKPQSRKRRFLQDYNSLPYGHENIGQE